MKSNMNQPQNTWNFKKRSEERGLARMQEMAKKTKRGPKSTQGKECKREPDPPLPVNLLLQKFKVLKPLIETSSTHSVDYIQAALYGCDMKTMNTMMHLGLLRVKAGSRGVFEIGEFGNEEDLGWMAGLKRRKYRRIYG